MPITTTPQRKFHTTHKFGKKRKKRQKKLLHGAVQLPASLNVDDEVREPEREDVASTAPSTSVTSSERVRLDTVMLSASEIDEREKKAEEKLKELSSTSATTRKAALMAGVSGAEQEAPVSAESFIVVSLDVVNSLLQLAKCKACCGDVELIKCDREYGLALKLKLCCKICGDVASEWSSPRVGGPNKITPCGPSPECRVGHQACQPGWHPEGHEEEAHRPNAHGLCSWWLLNLYFVDS